MEFVTPVRAGHFGREGGHHVFDFTNHSLEGLTRDLDAATVDTVMQVNFLGPTRLTLALLPQMLPRSSRSRAT